MPLKNDWQNGDLFTPAAANDMANTVNSAIQTTATTNVMGIRTKTSATHGTGYVFGTGSSFGFAGTGSPPEIAGAFGIYQQFGVATPNSNIYKTCQGGYVVTTYSGPTIDDGANGLSSITILSNTGTGFTQTMPVVGMECGVQILGTNQVDGTYAQACGGRVELAAGAHADDVFIYKASVNTQAGYTGTMGRFVAFHQVNSPSTATLKYGVQVIDPVVSETALQVGLTGFSGEFRATAVGHNDSSTSFLYLALPSSTDVASTCTGIRIQAGTGQVKALQEWWAAGGSAAATRITSNGTVQSSAVIGVADAAFSAYHVSMTSSGLALASGKTIELGHASDTTLSRSAAGKLAVEGVDVLLTGGALGTPSSGTLTNCTFPTLNQSTSGNAATATTLETARNISGVSFNGSANIDVVTAKTVGQSFFPSGYVSGNYYYANGVAATTTSAIQGNGSVRLTPWVVTDSITVTRLFAEFTVAGDANSIYRIGIWSHDQATGKPTTLVLDAGSISTGTGNAGTVSTGGTPGIYEITVSQALTPGLYWVGGAVQGVTSVQPTMRTVANYTYPLYIPLGASLPAANATFGGMAIAGQTGALATTSSASVSSISGARIGFKVS